MERLEDSRKSIILYLTIIGAAGLSLRLVYFPYDVPITLDAVSYFWYAIDTNVLGHFPDNYNFPNTGWPTLLSFFFTVFHSDNFMDYMTLQRLISVSVSVSTIIPVYLICRKFFNKQIALLGAAVFVLEPHTVQNSLIGISDPLYIFLIALSFAFLHSNNQKIVYLSFAMGALASLTRYEGLLFFGVLTVVFFTRYRKERRVLAKYAIACSIFIVVLLPSLYLRIQSTGDDGLTSHVVSGVLVANSIAINEENGLSQFIISGSESFIKYLGWIMIPYFVVLVPYGVFLIVKHRHHRKMSLFLSMIVLSLPAFYAYARQIQEPRYLLVLIPFFSVLSLFLLEKIWKRDRSYKVILIVILAGILISSTIFLELKKIDIEHEKEAYAVAQEVVKSANVVNSYYPESKFLKAASITNKEFPSLSSSVVPPLTVSTDGFSYLEEFIESNKKSGLTGLIIDNNEQRPDFLKDVYLHEEKYPYLIKTYDSAHYGYGYHVKIFKIDYEQFSYK
nr:glycosyltransferase family 39 protein [Candidatus Nitrosotenuis chungbukensis]